MKSWLKKLRYWEQEPPEQDPIVGRSLAVPLAVCSLLMMLSLIWAFYEEGWGLRPWRTYQAQFREVYPEALRGLKPAREQEEQAIKASSGYQELQSELQDVEANIQANLQSLDQAEGVVRHRLDVITKIFANARSEVQAQRYLVETGIWAEEWLEPGFDEPAESDEGPPAEPEGLPVVPVPED